MTDTMPERYRLAHWLSMETGSVLGGFVLEKSEVYIAPAWMNMPDSIQKFCLDESQLKLKESILVSHQDKTIG